MYLFEVQTRMMGIITPQAVVFTCLLPHSIWQPPIMLKKLIGEA